MAEIDKALPNSNLGVPTEEDIQNEIQTSVPETVDEASPDTITQNEDGSVDINLDPNAMDPNAGMDFGANLAEFLDDSILGAMGTQIYEDFVEYKSSRKDWEQAYVTGLDLLGFKYEQRTEPFQGASGATHPVLAEAVTQFQALAYKELLPAEGPVRTQILGNITPEKQQQADRVKEFMNYQMMDVMKEYEPEFDQMLFYLPLAGSTFKKVYYDSLLNRAVSQFIPADDLVVPYTATSLEDADSIIHVIRMSKNDLRKQQVNGFYRDIELEPGDDLRNDIRDKQRQLEGTTATNYQELFTLFECHTYLDLEGFEDKDASGEPTGIKLPYIVTIEEASRQVLSVRRNWEQADVKKAKIPYLNKVS